MRINLNPEIWGPKAWFFIESAIISYPDNPTNIEKENFKNFINSLIYILPCNKCRNNFKIHISKYPLNDNILNKKNNLLNWIIKIHNISSNKNNNINDTINYYNSKFKKKNYKIYYLIFLVLFLIIFYYIFNNNGK